MAYGLTNRAADENDIRNAEDRLSAEEVAEHTSDQTTEERTERCRGRDKFLLYLSAAFDAHGSRKDIPSGLKTTRQARDHLRLSREPRKSPRCHNLI